MLKKNKEIERREGEEERGREMEGRREKEYEWQYPKICEHYRTLRIKTVFA